MKKTFIGILCTMLMIISTTLAFAENAELNPQLGKLAKEVVIKHMNAIDNGIQNEDYTETTSAVNTYLLAKESAEKNHSKKENYTIQPSIIEFEVIDDATYVKVGVIASWNYENANFDSGYGKTIDVLIDNLSGEVVDIYDESDAFEIAIRGSGINIKDKNKRLSSTVAESAARKYSEKSEKTALEIETAISDERASIQNKKEQLSRSAYSWIDHDKVVTWARNNYYKSTPTSGRPGVVSYYDFSQISGAYDCTNFVSHALLAGDARIYDTGNSGISSTGWYYRNESNRSSSWSGVIDLHSFVTNNTTYGPGGYSTTWSKSDNSWSIGDIMQFHNGSKWIHSTVITGFVYYENGTTIPIVTGRSGKNQYNNNQEATEIYGNNAKRVLHLYNYGA